MDGGVVVDLESFLDLPRQSDRSSILKTDHSHGKRFGVYLVDPETGMPIVTVPDGNGGTAFLDPRLDNLLPIKAATELSGSNLSALLTALTALSEMLGDRVSAPGTGTPIDSLLTDILAVLTSNLPDDRLDQLGPIKDLSDAILALLQQRLPVPTPPIAPPIKELVPFDSGLLSTADPMVESISTIGGRIQRVRFINGLNFDLFAQFVSPTDISGVAASTIVYAEVKVPARQMVSISDFDDSHRFTRQYWVRFSRIHRNYEEVLVDHNLGYVTGEIVNVR
jgi:hypothetical protein